MAKDPSSTTAPDFLTPGSVRLKHFPDFKLIGRTADLNTLHDTLMRKGDRNNAMVFGQNGVGLSSFILSLQAAKEDKEDLTTPLEILEKNYFYLDVNALFSQTDTDAITASFKKVMEKLRQTPNAVLVIEDANSFVNGVVNNRAASMFNELLEATGTNHEFQTIFTGADADLPALLGCHADIAKNFTLQPLRDPPKDDLRAILDDKAKKIGEKYGIAISEEAVKSLMDLTEKYPGITSRVGFTQPRCSIELLEGAAVTFCRATQARPEGLEALEKKLADITAAEGGETTGKDLDDVSPEELAVLRQKTEQSVDELTEQWRARQKEIRTLRRSIENAVGKMQGVIDTIDRERAKENAVMEAYQACAEAEKDTETKDAAIARIKKDLHDCVGVTLVYPPEKSGPYSAFNDAAAKGGFITNPKIRSDEEILSKSRANNEENKAKYAELTKKDDGTSLTMTDQQVLTEFSRVSRIEVTKLKQNESRKLLDLEEILGKRIFGQPEPLKGLAKAVRRSKAGMKDKTAAIGNFLFLGPTGTGKTETALALAEALFDDDRALQKYPMENYMEENSVTGLVGAPQGYMGHEQGGQLVNNMLERPSCVNLFDEIEKAHAKVINTFLAITDTKNAYLIDRRTGEKVSFANAVNIFTSNVGQQYFLDPNLSRERARELALEELRKVESGKFRPEFLGRLKIFCYDKLDSEAVFKIAEKSLREVNDLAVDQGIKVLMPVEEIKQMSQDVYDPLTGGRGVVNFINDEISSQISDIILEHQDVPGAIEISYIPGKVTDDETAQIRKTTEQEDKSKITHEVQLELIEQYTAAVDGDPAALKKIVLEKQDAAIKERIDKKIAGKIKNLAREKALISTAFVPDGGKGAAPRIPANTNDPAARPAVG